MFPRSDERSLTTLETNLEAKQRILGAHQKFFEKMAPVTAVQRSKFF